jgi:hypothetical protein
MSLYNYGPLGVLMHAVLASVWFWLAVLVLMVLGVWKVFEFVMSLFGGG